MNLDIVIIDFLSPDGRLDTYKIFPKNSSVGITIDRYSDIFPDRFSKYDLDIGGVRIYNSHRCSIERCSSRLRSFRINESQHIFSFQFEHMGVPIGLSRKAHGGIYNFVLPPGWRCRELYVSDPYDQNHDDIRKKKQFEYSVYWDPECSTQFVEMLLRSSRGSFSFIVAGSASLVVADALDTPYIASQEKAGAISQISNKRLLDSEGRKRLAGELAKKSNWLELKPNIFGVGINLNQIIKDAMHLFQKRLIQSSRKCIIKSRNICFVCEDYIRFFTSYKFLNIFRQKWE